MGIESVCVRFVQQVRVMLLRWPRNFLCSQRRPSHVYAWAIRWPLRSRKLTGTERGGRPRSTTASSHVYYFTLFKVLSRCRSRNGQQLPLLMFFTLHSLKFSLGAGLERWLGPREGVSHGQQLLLLIFFTLHSLKFSLCAGLES